MNYEGMTDVEKAEARMMEWFASVFMLLAITAVVFVVTLITWGVVLLVWATVTSVIGMGGTV